MSNGVANVLQKIGARMAGPFVLDYQGWPLLLTALLPKH
jgi:hypothetical protein